MPSLNQRWYEGRGGIVGGKAWVWLKLGRTYHDPGRASSIGPRSLVLCWGEEDSKDIQ